MDKINGSPLMQSGMLDQTRQNTKLDEKREQDDSVKNSDGLAHQPATGDTAEISDTAHRLMELRLAVETGRAAMAGMPEVREEKVAQARERLKSGFYDQREVRDQVAAGIAGVISSMENL